MERVEILNMYADEELVFPEGFTHSVMCMCVHVHVHVN